jgi:AcrR family transcriptional regulator
MSDTTDAILDAARSSILDFGVRRTTLTDIARRAGVSRMTVYRRYPDVGAVLRDLMTREFGALMERAGEAASGADGRALLVERIVLSVRALREHPLLRKLVDAEPELLLPYLLGRMGETQLRALQLIEHDVRAGQDDGSIRAGDPGSIALGMLLLAQAFVFSHVERGDDELLAELARVADGALAPV